MAAALSSLLLDNIGPFHAWAVSDDPMLRNGMLVGGWTVSCIAYLLFALLLTRHVDHRPVRAAGRALFPVGRSPPGSALAGLFAPRGRPVRGVRITTRRRWPRRDRAGP